MFLGMGDVTVNDDGTVTLTGDDLAAAAAYQAAIGPNTSIMPSSASMAAELNAMNLQNSLHPVTNSVSSFFSQNGQAIVAVCAVLGLIVTVRK